MPNIKLTDEETGYLFGMLYERLRQNRYRRRRSSPPRSEAEKLAHRLAQSIKGKLRRAMPRGSQRIIETIISAVD